MSRKARSLLQMWEAVCEFTALRADHMDWTEARAKLENRVTTVYRTNLCGEVHGGPSLAW